MKDLFTYDNGKPLVSPWRRNIAQHVTAAEFALDGFCFHEVHRRHLEGALHDMNKALREPTLRNAKYRLGLPDPWVDEVNERVQAIEIRVELLKSSGQL